MSDKNVLTDVYFIAYRDGGGGSPRYHIPSHEKALRAVAEAAIAADRAARAESVAWALIEPSGHVTAVRIEREQLEETYMVAGEELTPLYTTPPAATVVPEGWKLVPVEPTKAMWDAVNKLDDEMAAGSYDGKGCSIEQAWDCLLAAAPAPSQEQNK